MMFFGANAKKDFNVESVISNDVETIINRCADIYRGTPYWVDDSNHIKTINFAKSICSETARLTTLAIKISVDGSARAEWLQNVINKEYFNIRKWYEYACAFGTVIIKPNGETIDLYTPGKFMITDCQDGEITGVVFSDTKNDESGKKHYTRLEYHRFEGDNYLVSNRCYISDDDNFIGKPINIVDTPWNNIIPDVSIANVEKPLFGVLRTPHANNIDIGSPISLPIFSDAIEELKDLDIAYSRNAKEIYDSKRTVLLDSDRMILSGTPINRYGFGFEQAKKELDLPDYIKNVFGDGTSTFYQEINPQLNTEMRIAGINALLSQIGYKCGFSNGYFVFNESSGIQTATGVEADQQRTIQFIKDCRDKLECCMNDIVYALNAFADLYDLSPVGTYEVFYDFGDITYNHEEDRARWLSYANSGKIPFWYYLVKFEGFTEEDAKEITSEMEARETGFFGGGE